MASKPINSNSSRRDFLKTSAAVSLGLLGTTGSSVFAAGSDTIRVGLIGCGARGTGAALDCVQSTPGVQITAMADVFSDKLDSSLANLSRTVDDRISVTSDSCFTGFDAYQKLLALEDIDMIIHATPPHFRPAHVRAAIEAGKHVFMEKPAAVDPVGIRSLLKTADLADKKGLSIVVGTQQRRQPQYIEILKRIRDGQIGDVVAAQCYWHWNEANWHFHKRRSNWSDMEWQIRCWPYFTWLSGDHIVEQHVHNIDIVNWVIGSHPIKCTGIGGRQARTGTAYGNIFDHFAVEYEYPGGIRVASYSSQIKGGHDVVGERIVGSKGTTYTTRRHGSISGQNPFVFEDKIYSGMKQEHADLISSIRNSKPINEVRHIAESTMSGIMGRMSAYTGRSLKWEWVMNSSKLDLTPAKYELSELPVAEVAIPGKTKLI